MPIWLLNLLIAQKLIREHLPHQESDNKVLILKIEPRANLRKSRNHQRVLELFLILLNFLQAMGFLLEFILRVELENLEQRMELKRIELQAWLNINNNCEYKGHLQFWALLIQVFPKGISQQMVFRIRTFSKYLNSSWKTQDPQTKSQILIMWIVAQDTFLLTSLWINWIPSSLATTIERKAHSGTKAHQHSIRHKL